MAATEAKRMAECYCGRTLPSDTLHLAFLQDRGPDSRPATLNCRHCGYHEVAHTSTVGSRHPTQSCPGFEPHGEYPNDIFYCGCRGWE